MLERRSLQALWQGSYFSPCGVAILPSTRARLERSGNGFTCVGLWESMPSCGRFAKNSSTGGWHERPSLCLVGAFALARERQTAQHHKLNSTCTVLGASSCACKELLLLPRSLNWSAESSAIIEEAKHRNSKVQHRFGRQRPE